MPLSPAHALLHDSSGVWRTSVFYHLQSCHPGQCCVIDNNELSWLMFLY
jgi:hypothetical protein